MPDESSNEMVMPAEAAALLQRFERRDALIGLIGLGYGGLPLMLAFCHAGFRTLGFDIDAGKASMLNGGACYLKHIDAERIGEARATQRFEATCDFARLDEADAILICVPTLIGRHREPDLSFVEATARDIAKRLRPGQLVVLESTTYPGTTREVVKPILKGTGLVSGKDFFLAYSPEREDPGNPSFGTATIPKVVAGDGDLALRLALSLYDGVVVNTVAVSSMDTAEAVR